MENLLDAWQEFVSSKRGKLDVQLFSLRLMDNILELHADLVNGTYMHGGYYAFNISDPKPRNIHKAQVRDRLLHHALYRILYPFFDLTFTADSFSCRKGKGTHAALNRFRSFAYKVSKNNTRTCWVLKCDIKKFFASIDHEILFKTLHSYIPDTRIIALLQNVVGSFSSTAPNVGLPLGNLTSQLLVNIYMNEFDQYAKHSLKAKHYIRYADDFVIFSHDHDYLVILTARIHHFLISKLRLTLHPKKVSIGTLAAGVDFLGWVHFSDHRVLRTATKKRMWRRLLENKSRNTVTSYTGMLQHGNARGLMQQVQEFSDGFTEAELW